MDNSEPFNITILSEMVDFPITDLTSMTRAIRTLGERLVPNSAAKSAKITEKLSLPSILSLLQYGNDDLSDATSTLIQRLLEPLPVNVILSQFKDWINEGLTSESDQLKALALSVWVNREHDINSLQLILNTYGTQLLDCIANTESPKVAQLAIKPFVASANDESTLSIILSSPIIDSIHKLFNRGAIVKTRVLDLLIQMASVSKSTYLKLKESNLFSNIDACIGSDDLLLKLNTLEILVSASESHLGGSFLDDFNFQQKIWNNLENHPASMTPESLESLCYCAELKFIAQSWKLYPADNELSTLIIKKLEYSLQDKFNNDIKEAAVYSYGIIGSTPAGMIALNKQKTALRKFVRFSRSTVDRLKVECLRTFALMMGSKKTPSDESSELVESVITLYNLLAENGSMPGEFVKLAQNPIEPIKIASYDFLFNLSTYHWGIKELVDSSVFMKFLFNRSLDSTYLGMKMKYKIVGTILANHDKPSPILDEKLIEQFKNYLNQGEFYSESVPEVATQNI